MSEGAARLGKIADPWLEAPIGDEWIAAYRVVPQDGGAVIAELRVFPAEPKRRRAGTWGGELLGPRACAPRGGLDAALLRQVRIGEHRQAALRMLEAMREQPDGGLSGEPRRRRGRRGHADIFYAELARDYVEACDARSLSPAADLAKRHRLSPARVRDLLHEARHRGLLTKVGHGKPGGLLTSRAKALLHDSSDRPADDSARARIEP